MTGENGQGTASAVAVGVLGDLEIRVNDVPMGLGHARQRSVLAVLVTEANRVVPPDRLIDGVWGEHAPVRARSVLRTYLSNLRRALAAAGIAITWRDNGYRLTVDPDAVDVHHFRRLLGQARADDDPRRALTLAEQALELWRGEPLADLDTPWAQSVRERLRHERAAAEADRVDWALACGRHRDLLPELTARAGEHPLDERAAAQLMLALYRTGRPADALQHYQHIRQRLAEELGADPGPALKQLHQRVLTADPALTLPQTATSRTPPPRQLPAAPAPFVGRHDELARLDAAQEDATTVVVSAVAGAGGIGKTWLALHWAHRNADRFPDGQLFVDLRGFSTDGEPMNPAVAVRGFLDALGVDPARMPPDLDSQAALYRSLIAEKRMLVVLDNAATADQVAPLLPGTSTCTVVITGRTTLPLLIDRHGARHLQLGVLTREEAHALLVQRIGAARVTADPAVDDLIDLCGRYPLALSITARHASTRPHVPLAEFTAELRELGLDVFDNDDPAVSLPAVLSWSLRGLTPEQRTVFALLGVAPGPDIDLPAAASLVGLSAAQTRKALHALENASLIDRHAHGRYAMHDLIRAYAAGLAHDLPAGVKEVALERVVDFYLHTAHNAALLLDPSGIPIQLVPPTPCAHSQPLPDYQAALAWLELHHPHLLATQHTAATRRRYQAVWHLAWTLTTFHQRRGHYDDELAVWHAATDAAAHLPDPTTRALAHRRLGQTHAELGRHEQAIGHLRQALALAEQHHDLTQRAHAHRVLARVWARQGDDRRALEAARHGLDLYRTLDQPVWEANALNQVGWYAARLDDHDTARSHCEAALALQRHHQDHEGEAGTLDSLGYIAHRTGRHDEAVHHYRQALTVLRTLGNTTQVADTLDSLGHPHAALGRHEQARAAWEEALELYRQQGRDTDAERVQRQLDDFDEA